MTAEGQTVLVVALDNPLAENVLAARLGRAAGLDGHRDGMERNDEMNDCPADQGWGTSVGSWLPEAA
jgi:hypothetical protein